MWSVTGQVELPSWLLRFIHRRNQKKRMKAGPVQIVLILSREGGNETSRIVSIATEKPIAIRL